MERALADGDLTAMARRVYNVFEDVLDRRQSEIFSIKSQLIALGAVGAAMTGTGSAVFGIFDEEAAAKAAYQTLAPQYKDCCLTRPAGPADIG
jgi:4-diphosphocytidyl-2-C-methyl-D-erythritol kinase